MYLDGNLEIGQRDYVKLGCSRFWRMTSTVIEFQVKEITMKKLHKLLMTTAAIVRVSKLIAISLLCLVGCSVKNTGVAESDISGCWARTVFIQQGQVSVYQKNTYKLEPGGSYTGERIGSSTTLSGASGPTSHTLSGKWIVDDGYVVIQEGDGDKLTLKVISKHELIQVGSDYPAFTRC
jgi:hypothetical protein